MKIAILTLPLHVNYGGYLQAYALQKTLEGMGHKVSLLVFDKQSKWHTWASYIKWKMMNPFRNVYGVEDSFRDFFMLNINKAYYKCSSDISRNDFNIYVVGSDQVWRKKFIKDLSLAFLQFTEGWHVKRIAYAPSFGNAAWDYTKEETDMCKKLLSKFESVSVREESGVELCKDYFDVESKVVLDPTLIAPKQIYDRLLKKQYSDVGTFVYFVKRNAVSFDYSKVLSSLASRKYKEVFLPCSGISSGKLPTIQEWLSSIVHADNVLTDSFHACVFCLLYHKDFWVMPSAWGGRSRFETLLEPLGLGDRILLSEENFHHKVKSVINWQIVDKKLSKLIESSQKYLFSAISNEV